MGDGRGAGATGKRGHLRRRGRGCTAPPPERVPAAWESSGRRLTRRRLHVITFIMSADVCYLGGGAGPGLRERGCQLWESDGIFQWLSLSLGRRRGGGTSRVAYGLCFRGAGRTLPAPPRAWAHTQVNFPATDS